MVDVSPQTPTEYLRSVPEEQAADIKALDALIRKLAPTLQPFVIMTGKTSILGYGQYHYKTKSGCEGEWFVLGLASRKQGIALYSCVVSGGQYLPEKYAAELGKVSTGKSCIRFKRLADLNESVLKQLITESAAVHLAGTNEMYN